MPEHSASQPEFLHGRIRRLLTANHRDDRGWLSPLEFGPAGMVPVRAFAVCAPDGTARGGHAHSKCRQVLMLVTGRIAVDYSDGQARGRFWLDETDRAVLVEPRVWTRQTFHGANTTLMVFCDLPYDPMEYIHDEAELGG